MHCHASHRALSRWVVIVQYNPNTAVQYLFSRWEILQAGISAKLGTYVLLFRYEHGYTLQLDVRRSSYSQDLTVQVVQ